MLLKISAKEELLPFIQDGQIFMACIGNSEIQNSANLVHSFKEIAEKMETQKFVLLDETLKASLKLPFEPGSAITYYIFRNGYMLFQRDVWIGFDDVLSALQFAVAIDMDAWLSEEPRVRLSV